MAKINWKPGTMLYPVPAVLVTCGTAQDGYNIITIAWTGSASGGDKRIALARKEQPDFSWIAVFKVGEQKTMTITLPDEAALYEVRFLNLDGPELLGRSVVEVR